MNMMSNSASKEVLLHQGVNSETAISFSGFVKEKRRLLSLRLFGAKYPKKTEAEEKPKKMISTKGLAEIVGIKTSMFPKILNMQKPTKERDCIIAICIALQLESDEADKALHLYNNMPCLDYSIPREQFLIELMDEHSTDDPPITIDTVNDLLEENGFDKLNIGSSRKNNSNSNANKYDVSEIKTQTFADELVFGDQYDSLDTEYSPYRYKRIVAEMTIKEKEGNRGFVLSCDAQGVCYIRTYEKGKGLIDVHHYPSLSETGEFKSYYLQLRSEARRELKSMLNVLDDTKNYSCRVSAGIRDDAFCIYAEVFNYSIPEINEYYYMEKIGDRYHFQVFNESVFMHKYLSEQEYRKWYSKSKKMTLVAEYYSIDEIDALSKDDNYINKAVLRFRKRAFSKLQDEIDKMLNSIRNKKRYVRNLEYIYEDHDRVCSFFKVEQEYQCSLDGDYGDIMSANRDSFDFVLNDGITVSVTLQDLYIAFELGFNDIYEICRVKNKMGSIEAVLK